MSVGDYVAATPSNLTKRQVFALGESVAKQLKYQPGDDLRSLMESVGGSVRVEDTLTVDPGRSGSLYVDSPEKFSIIVPAHTSPRRDQFTIAHEFGHFILHYILPRQSGKSPVIDRMIAYRRGSERVEWEANWFAAAFLMPADKFRAEYAEHDGDISLVANTFGVSEDAAEIRAKQLSLIS